MSSQTKIVYKDIVWSKVSSIQSDKKDGGSFVGVYSPSVIIEPLKEVDNFDEVLTKLVGPKKDDK